MTVSGRGLIIVVSTRKCHYILYPERRSRRVTQEGDTGVGCGQAGAQGEDGRLWPLQHYGVRGVAFTGVPE